MGANNPAIASASPGANAHQRGGSPRHSTGQRPMAQKKAPTTSPNFRLSCFDAGFAISLIQTKFLLPIRVLAQRRLILFE